MKAMKIRVPAPKQRNPFAMLGRMRAGGAHSRPPRDKRQTARDATEQWLHDIRCAGL